MRTVQRLGVLAWVLAVCLAVGSLPVSQVEAAANEQARVDLNEADQKQLESLPGIGPSIAKRIVEFREKHGPFKRVEDVLKVRGIGEKSFQKIRDRITVGKKG